VGGQSGIFPAMSWDLDPQGGAVVVRMRSNAVNRMNPALFDDLHRAFDALDREHPGRPAVLVGEGKTFSAGLDFDHVFPLFRSGDAGAVASFFEAFRGAMLRVLFSPRLLVAAVNGNAFAGGLILACACDARLLARGPGRLALNEVAIGIAIPSTYMEIVRHAVGTRVAAEAALLGRVYDVDEAVAAGFALRAVEPVLLLEEAVALAGSVSPDTADVFAATKRSVKGPLAAFLEGPARELDAEALRAIGLASSGRAQAAAFARLKKR
jgi:enoyl-CoA hydratase